MPPSVPPWLEELVQRLVDNDPTLTSLELSHPRIDDVFAKVVANALEDNTTVTSMVVSCFSIVDDGAYALGSVLAKSKTLQKLQFRELRNSRETITLFRLLRHNTYLHELSLRHCQICPLGAETMETFFRHHTHLHEVRFVDCQFVGDSLERISQGLAATPSPLQRLYLVNTELGADRSIHISEALQSCTSLRELILSENDLGDSGVNILTLAVLRSTSLRLLDLRSNGITSTGALSLQGIITRSPFVVSLRLGNNQLGDGGASALARGLSQSRCVLQSLDLSDNGIELSGARALSQMLRHNTSLCELNLSFNGVGDGGAHALALALQRNITLQNLNLRRSNLTNHGALTLSRSIPRMNGLKELILNKNNIDATGLVALLDALQNNVELEYLQVVEKLTDSVSQQLVHWIRLNKAGRRIFRQTNAVHPHLWPMVYGRVSAESDVLFHFLKEKPEAMVLA